MDDRNIEAIVKAFFKYKDGVKIELTMNRDLDYEIIGVKASINNDIKEFENLEELYLKDKELLDRVLKSYMIWLLFSFNKTLSRVKDEGIKFCDMIDTWIDSIEGLLSPSLLAIAYNPSRREALKEALNTLIKSYNEILNYLYSDVKLHCKKLSKYIKGLHRLKEMEYTRRTFYDVYSYWLSSEHREEALKEYDSHGIEKILMEFLPLTVKFRLMDIGRDPFDKINFLAGLNLQICRAYEDYHPILNSHLTLLESIRDEVDKIEDITSAEIDKIYERIMEIADEASKISISLRGIYVNLEPL
ncbi:MAG TPA: hypothetical protein ENF47_02245 [Thermoprotei archaeon]|nr:hypothetical protein [Thermoprotei archaeon]